MMKKRIYLRQAVAVLLSICMILGNLTTAMAESATGTTLRLMKTEGEVEISNSSGKQISLIQDMKLYNGYHVETQQESYAWINLDSEKLTKLDAVSEAEIRQKGKALEILLNSGNLYFNVTNPLNDDETLNIRTSSMVVGIRGTAGWVKVINQWHSSVYVLEGTVVCSVTDPVSGQTKTAVVHAGEMADTFVYQKDKEGDKADIFINRYGRDSIDGFVLVELVDDLDVQRRVYPNGGAGNLPTYDESRIKLKSDQDIMRKKLEAIEEELKQQETGGTIEPVWQNEPDSGNGDNVVHEKSSSKSPTTSEFPSEPEPEEPTEPEQPEIINLTMKVTDDEVDSYLGLDGVTQVIVKANPELDNTENTLLIDSGINVPSGKTLTLETGVNMNVNGGQVVQVDGTLDMAGELQNSGTINVTSSNSLRVANRLVNQASGTIYSSETGHIVAANGVENYGRLNNYGVLEGNLVSYDGSQVYVSGGSFEKIELKNSSLDSRLLNVKINELIVTNSHLIISENSNIQHLRYQGNDDDSSRYVRIEGGIVEKAEIESGSLYLNSNTSVVELLQYGGSVNGYDDVSIEKLEIQAGTTWLDADINVNIDQVLQTGGELAIAGGTLKEIRQDEGNLEVIGGEVEKIILTQGNCNINRSSYRDEEGNLIYAYGTVGEVEQSGGSLSLIEYGRIKNGIRLSQTAEFFLGNAVLEAGTSPAALYMCDEANVTIYEGTIDGGNKKAIQIEGGNLQEGGVVGLNNTEIKGSIEQNGGSLTFYRGILGDITQSAGEFNMIGGEAKKVTISGGEFGIGGNFAEDIFGIIEQIEQSGGRIWIKDDGGRIQNGIVVGGTGSFEMQGGTVEAETASAALLLKDNGDVQLHFGTLHGNEQKAIQVEGGNLEVDGSVKIRGNHASNMLAISDNGIEKAIQIWGNTIASTENAIITCQQDETGLFLSQIAGETEVETVLSKVSDGETIALPGNITIENLVEVGNGTVDAPVILDLGTNEIVFKNGISLNGNAVWQIDGSKGGTVRGNWLVHGDDAKLFFHGGSYYPYEQDTSLVHITSGAFVADGGAELSAEQTGDKVLLTIDDGEITIDDARIKGQECVIATEQDFSSPVITIHEGAELSSLTQEPDSGVLDLVLGSPTLYLHGGTITSYYADSVIKWNPEKGVLGEEIGTKLKAKNSSIFIIPNPEDTASYISYIPEGYRITGPDSEGFYSLEPEALAAALFLEEDVESDLSKPARTPQDKDSTLKDKPLASSSDAQQPEISSKSQVKRKTETEKDKAEQPEKEAENLPQNQPNQKQPEAAIAVPEDKRKETKQGRESDDEK